MANRKIDCLLIKRSNIPGKIPAAGSIAIGELALNTADVKLYASGTTTNSILEIGWDRIARTGDTMTGTLFTPFLSATTVSATTYLNLPIDIRVTGGTPNNTNHLYTFTNNTGGTFNVVGLTDITVTGASIINGVTTFTNNTGGTFSVSGFVTGDTYWISGSSGTFSLHAKNNTAIDATGNYALAEGSGTLASGIASHAEGQLTRASGNQSHAEGSGTTASGLYSHSEGLGNIASGIASHAEGGWDGLGVAPTVASGISSHAEGQGSTALGSYSHAEGDRTKAIGDSSHAEGQQSTSSGNLSHAEGSSTASGLASHSEGGSTTSSNDNSHSEGYFSIASGTVSHAEGWATLASGDTSHAEGYQTTAGGQYSHAGGESTIASGLVSFVHGSNSRVNGNYSAVFGRNITGNTADTVYVPFFNIQSATTDNTLTNILVRDASGNVKLRTVSSMPRVTGFTYSNNTFTIRDNTGGTFNALFNTVTGLTVNGNLSATTISATTISGFTIVSTGIFIRNGFISPPTITTFVNDYNPTGLSTANVMRINSNFNTELTGIVAQESGREIIIFNVGGYNIKIKNENAGSVAPNRFSLNGDAVLGINESATIWYDITSARWRLVSRF